MQYTKNLWYLLQINQSPTSHLILANAMRGSLQIVQEVKKNSIAVTYDLTIAKIAMQI